MREPVTLNWPGGEDRFLLRLGELEALDDQTEAGVLDLRFRISLGQVRGSLSYAPVKVREIMACIRLGLIGGGMDPDKAQMKAKTAVLENDIGELALLTFIVLTKSLEGKPHDPVGEAAAAENPPE